MSIELYFAFIVASSLLMLIPGPIVLFILGHSISNGKLRTHPLLLGIICGDVIVMTLSLLGLGALMAASATLFNIFKIIGAVYLIYIGILMWRKKSETPEDNQIENKLKSNRLFQDALLITVFNPKSIIFFVAFFPQFIIPNKDYISQLCLLGITFSIISAISVIAYKQFGSSLRHIFCKSEYLHWFNKGAGASMITAGLITASSKHSS